MGIRRNSAAQDTVTCGCYRYDPYNKVSAIVAVTSTASAASTPRNGAAATATDLPPLLHAELTGKVAFYAFPTEAYDAAPLVAPKEQLARVFFGQLPYSVTDMELDWLCGTFARGAQVAHSERIVKKSPTNATKKMPTGCVHTYCDPRDVQLLIDLLDKRVMFDDCGVWYAENATQKAALDAYCLKLKENAALRPADRPYQPVVVQPATSTYIPNLNARRRSPATTPPPPYNF